MLQEKVAVVTGSSTGIGYETALTLSKKWVLYLCYNAHVRRRIRTENKKY